MTHEEIDSRNVAERYLMGKLSAEESVGFEEHYVDCPRCLDRIEATERFRAALKPVAARDAARAFRSRSAFPWWPRTALLVAATFVLTVALSVFLGLRNAAMRRELEQTKVASLDWQHRFEAARRQPAPANDAAPAQPLAGTTFFLSTSRGAEPDTSAPANRIAVSADSHRVILSLDRELEPGSVSLRVSLTESTGKSVWQQSGLRATAGQPLSVVLPTSLLHRGDYVLTVEGLSSSSGRYRAAGRYRFRVAIR